MFSGRMGIEDAGYANRFATKAGRRQDDGVEPLETGLRYPAEEPSAEAIGQALAAAAALGERMVADAHERADALRSEAEAEAAGVLAAARAEVARLEREAGELRSFLQAATNEFVATARAALAHLDELDGRSKG
jgi:regulator of protease activity HflC (stomatin/prohibitin superfamily)